MKVYQVLLIGFIIGLLSGYTWHYQAVKEVVCDDGAKIVMLNDKIPAKLLEVHFEDNW